MVDVRVGSAVRSLVFASMPEGATPESHVAAGPWCFAGREALFPGWDGTPHPEARPFPLPPDPYPDGPAIAEAAKAANREALRLARLLGPGLYDNSASGNGPLSHRFHDMALGPFLLLAVHMFAERQKRLLDLIALYGDESLRVEVLPADLPFSFQDCEDFKKNGVHDTAFNHYVYSRMLEAMAPDAWRLEYPDAPPPLHRVEKKSSLPLASRCRLFLRRRLRDLPFPRYKGFRLWQALLLSLAVLANKRENPDAAIDFARYCGDSLVSRSRNAVGKNNATPAVARKGNTPAQAAEPAENHAFRRGDFVTLDWRFPIGKLLEGCLPRALWENASVAKKLRQYSPPSRPGALRGMTAAYMEDDAYRLRLAVLLEKGCRLFSVQHGANYGNLLSLGSIPFEYSMHAFYTWGWSAHEGFPVNARPLPHPALWAIADRHEEKEPGLILVGAEMSAYSYRLKSRPQAGSLPEYRRSKLLFLREMEKFFSGLEPAPGSGEAAGRRAILQYRPYFRIPGGLDDEAYIRRNMPGTAICTGDLTARMLSCRLLVLDHYGTTLHMALAADVPCLAFWDREAWSMDENSEKVLAKLRHGGILHDSPEEAAARAAAVWEDVRGWWRSDAVRAARQAWLDSFALTGNREDAALSSLALTRLWFTAVRNC